MTPFIAELTGTAVLILLGDGVVANVVLNKTYGNNSGLIVIAFGWAIAVFAGVFISAGSSGAHLNPAITIGLAALGKFEWRLVPTYIAAQLLGAMIGAFLVWLTYRNHFDATESQASKLGVFCTSPAIESRADNFFSEIVGTFVLVIGALFIVSSKESLGALDGLPISLLVLGIGLSLGGTTGYAINPARDLGPRIMHAILPIKGKGSSNWKYGIVPVIAPIIGSLLAALCYHFIH
ncbi:MIP/aquaporin family protein [Ferruginibacter paludis]|jgi:glycerol uptake facilitator protein|uniref:MIP/aquaporin family protein n=1 Tax=Ferruginibacter TaxID=1004303 RepID=UPI0025B32AEF|nr:MULTISPECIES: MIP/aquaporin family protein [Ferruginibacter]MDB5278877.1 aquaporin family protein [Ferruginibacter sp.]MDN3654583.1 MIP/aquaporin family protein [Ferruginibacter paludis]